MRIAQPVARSARSVMAPPLAGLLWKPRNARPGAAARCAGAAEQRLRRGPAEPCAELVHGAGVPEVPRGHCREPCAERQLGCAKESVRRLRGRACGHGAGRAARSGAGGQRSGVRALCAGLGGGARRKAAAEKGVRGSLPAGRVAVRRAAGQGRACAAGTPETRRPWQGQGGGAGGCGGGQGRGRGPRAGGGGSLCSAGPRRRWNKGAAALLPALSLVLEEAPRSHRGPPDRSSPLGQTRPGGTGWPSRWDRPRMKKTQHPDGIERRARQGCGDRRRAARPEPRPVRSAQPGAVPERVPPAHPSPRVPPTPLGNSRVGSKSCGGSVPLLSRLRPQPSAAA